MFVFALMTISAAMSCREEKSPSEKIEEGIDDIGDGIEEGAEEVEDAAEDVTDHN
jgi:hypothetical protein